MTTARSSMPSSRRNPDIGFSFPLFFPSPSFLFWGGSVKGVPTSVQNYLFRMGARMRAARHMVCFVPRA